MDVQHGGYLFQASVSDDGATISGFGEVWGVLNEAGRVFVPGAFAQSLAELNPSRPLPIGWLHEVPIGKWTRIQETREGLRMEGRISQTTVGRDASILVRDGALTSLSIGFSPIDVQFASPREQARFETPFGTATYQFPEPVAYIVKAQLVETSLVMVGAQREARIVAVQSLGHSPRSIADELRRLADQLTDYEGGGS